VSQRKADRVIYEKTFGILRIHLTRSSVFWVCMIVGLPVFFIGFLSYGLYQICNEEGLPRYDKEYPLPMCLQLYQDTSDEPVRIYDSNSAIFDEYEPRGGSVHSLKWEEDYLIVKYIRHKPEIRREDFYPYCLYDFRNLTIYSIQDVEDLDARLKEVAGQECRTEFWDLPEARLQRETDLGFRFTKNRLLKYESIFKHLSYIKHEITDFKKKNGGFPKSLEELMSFFPGNTSFNQDLKEMERRGYKFQYRLIEDGAYYEIWAEGPPGSKTIRYPVEFCADFLVKWKVVYLPSKTEAVKQTGQDPA